MPPENEKKTKHLSKFETMTTQELEQLLQHDLDAPDPGLTADQILDISQEILRREPEAGPELTPQQSWQDFRARQPRKVSRRSLRTLLIAAVLAGTMTLSLMAGAVGGRDLRTVVGAQDIYGFYFHNVELCELTTPMLVDYEVDLGWDALTLTGYVPGLMPAWLPERYQQSEMIVKEDKEHMRYWTTYKNGGESLNVCIASFDDDVYHRLSVNGDPLEVYCYNDVIYYIFENDGWCVVVWFSDGYECNVSGDLTVEEARQIIRSME